MTVSPADGRPANSGAHGSLRTAALATGCYALLIGLLAVIIYSEDHTITVPLVVLSAIGLVLAAVMLTSGRRWTAWVAIGYALITLAGDAPHQLAALAHPSASPSHTVGGIVLIAAGLAALATAARAGMAR